MLAVSRLLSNLLTLSDGNFMYLGVPGSSYDLSLHQLKDL